MKKLFPFLLAFSSVFCCMAQNSQQTDTVKPPAEYENIYIRTLYHDSLVSSFLIFVKKEVKLHKHATHAEHVYVLEGEGEMNLGGNNIKVKKGSIVFIPADTIHSLKVTSKKPMKVLSFQAPHFDGKDRIMVPEPK